MNRFKLFILLFSLLYSGYSYSQVDSLSPEVRSLLNKEMIALQGGMQQIIPRMAAGETEQVATIAAKIKHSYILSQALTRKQKHELHTKLPSGFLTLDQAFHRYAGKLQHAAIENNNELMAFYYYKMTEACVTCHSAYAQHRFPKLGGQKDKLEHHH